jgi:hypothetical protein
MRHIQGKQEGYLAMFRFALFLILHIRIRLSHELSKWQQGSSSVKFWKKASIHETQVIGCKVQMRNPTAQYPKRLVLEVRITSLISSKVIEEFRMISNCMFVSLHERFVNVCHVLGHKRYRIHI